MPNRVLTHSCQDASSLSCHDESCLTRQNDSIRLQRLQGCYSPCRNCHLQIFHPRQAHPISFFFLFCVALPHCCACMVMYVKQVYNKYTHIRVYIYIYHYIYIYISKYLSLGRFSYLNELKTSWHRETTVRNSKALPFRSNLKISGDIKITGKWIFISN